MDAKFDGKHNSVQYVEKICLLLICFLFVIRSFQNSCLDLMSDSCSNVFDRGRRFRSSWDVSPGSSQSRARGTRNFSLEAQVIFSTSCNTTHFLGDITCCMRIFRFSKDDSEKPETVRDALKLCDIRFFPNINALLRLACTIPVSSNPCERSNSALRRLHHYTRTTMGEERLTNLALLHIHYDVKIDLDDVTELFIKKHPRRMELDSILKE